MRRDSPASGWGYLPLAGECPQFTEDHEAFRQLARDFVEKEIGPHYDDWERTVRCLIIAKSLGL
jgi:alkylation response protein AidB-like acyl-CoA dehydrogenase